MAYEDYDRYARRIERWDGVTIRERINSGRAGHIIDFEIDWPGVVYAEPEQHRQSAVEASAIIFNEPDEVAEWQLRLPQIPVRDDDASEVADNLLRRLQPIARQEWAVLLADGQTSWTPHVHPSGYTNMEADPGRVLDNIHEAWQAYQDWASERYGATNGGGVRA